MQYVSEAEPGARARSRFCLRGLGGDCRSRPPASKAGGGRCSRGGGPTCATKVPERDALADELRRRSPLSPMNLRTCSRVLGRATRGRRCQPERRAVDRPVETVARGIAPKRLIFLTTGVRLPPLDREQHASGQYLWPMPLNGPTVLPADLAKASAATGAEMRRIGEVVAARKRDEAISSTRSG